MGSDSKFANWQKACQTPFLPNKESARHSVSVSSKTVFRMLMGMLAVVFLTFIPQCSLRSGTGMLSYAGEWKQAGDGRYRYLNDDGSFPAGKWQNIGGKDYCFDAEGYMYSDTTTPDMYQVGEDGARLADYQLAIAAPADFSSLSETEKIDFFVRNEKAYGLKDSCALGKLEWSISAEGHTIVYKCNLMPVRALTETEKMLLKGMVALNMPTNVMGYETSKLYTRMSGFPVDFRAEWYVDGILEYTTKYAFTE